MIEAGHPLFGTRGAWDRLESLGERALARRKIESASPGHTSPDALASRSIACVPQAATFVPDIGRAPSTGVLRAAA